MADTMTSGKMKNIQLKIKSMLGKYQKNEGRRRSNLKVKNESPSLFVDKNARFVRNSKTRLSSKLRTVTSKIFMQTQESHKDFHNPKISPRLKHFDFEKQIAALKVDSQQGPDFKIYDYETPRKCATYVNLQENKTPVPPLPPRNVKEDGPVITDRKYSTQTSKVLIFDFSQNSDIWVG